eukprot:6190974-Pleurochrysis_carterae.AAC.2
MLSGKLPRIDSPALFETWLAAEYSTKGEGGAGSRVEQTGRARNEANAAAEAERNKSKKKPWQRALCSRIFLKARLLLSPLKTAISGAP